MRFILNLSLILTIASCNVTNNQTEESFSILSDLEGKSFNLNLYEGNVIILNIWATWCKPCKQELENIHEVYEDWQEETNVKLIAISIDDARNTSKIKPLVNAKGWEYEVYQDSNREFATKMGVNPIPHTFLLFINISFGFFIIIFLFNNFTNDFFTI